MDGDALGYSEAIDQTVGVGSEEQGPVLDPMSRCVRMKMVQIRALEHDFVLILLASSR